MADDFAVTFRPRLEPLLEPGETLHGVIAANEQKTLSGRLYALGVTDRRLILLPYKGRKLETGEPVSIAAGEIVSADADGAGGGWWTAEAAILDATALKVTLRTRDGVKRRLQMMRGTGVLGALGGGEGQRDGVASLVEFLRAHPPTG